MQINHDDFALIGLGVSTAAPGLPVGVHLRIGFAGDRADWVTGGFLSAGFSLYRRPHMPDATPSTSANPATEGSLLPGPDDPRVLVGVSGANYSFPVTGMGTMLPASLDAVISAYNGEWSGSLPVRAFELRMTFDVASGGSLDVEAFDGDVPVGGFQQSGPVTALTRSVTADRIDGFKVTGSGITITDITWHPLEATVVPATWTLIASGLSPSDDWAVVNPRLLTSEVPKLGGPGQPPWEGLRGIVADLWGGITGPVPLAPGSDPGPVGLALELNAPIKLGVAALDPTLARAIGLLYIDTAATPGSDYDYMVEGAYADDTYYWIHRKANTNRALPIAMPTTVTSEVGRGPNYRDAAGTLLSGGRIDLHFEPPESAGGLLRPDAPVRYQAETQPLGTGASPAPINPSAWVPFGSGLAATPTRPVGTSSWNSFRVRHRSCPAGWHGYQLTGLDLFGRTSIPLGPHTVQLPEDPSPPSPPAIVVRYLDANTPDLTSAEQAWVGTHGSGIRARWAWGPDQAEQNGGVAEFRLYHSQAGPDRRSGSITSVTDNGDGTYDIGTDINLVVSPADMVGGYLESVGAGHQVVAQVATASSTFTIVPVSRIDRTGTETPRPPEVGGNCYARADLRGAIRWDSRVYAQAHDLVPLSTSVSSVASAGSGLVQVQVVATAFTGHGHSEGGILEDQTDGVRYRVVDRTVNGSSELVDVTIAVQLDDSGAVIDQPASGNTLLFHPGYEVWVPGVALTPSVSAPVVREWVAISAADSDPLISDDPKWSSGSYGGRAGNEGPVSAPSPIQAVWATAPATPVWITPTSQLASEPDNAGQCSMPLSWNHTTGQSYELQRATAESLVAEYIRTSAPGTDPDSYTDATILSWASAAWAEDLFVRTHAEAISEDYLVGSAIEYADATLPGKGVNRFVYRLVAVDGAGNKSSPTALNTMIYVPIPAPAMPQPVSVLAGNNKITLKWRRVRDARYLTGTGAPVHRPELKEYRIYRAETPDEAADIRLMTLVATHTPTLSSPTEEWEDTAVSLGTTYYYRVAAYTERSVAGSEAKEGIAFKARSCRAVGMTLPTTPSISSLAYSTGVDVVWTAGADDTIRVERRESGFAWTDVSGNLTGGTTSFTDSSTESATTYSYRVKALNGLGFEANSSSSDITTP